MKKTSHGFTLVELLIVIVIIAILASITVVSYNGITNRARKASIQSDLTDVAKAIQMYEVLHSAYPSSAAELYQGSEPPITAQSFSRSSDPYHWTLYCTNGEDFVIAARQAGTTNWYASGSGASLRQADEAGVSGAATTTCANLGVNVSGSGSYSSWVKSNSGWQSAIR